MRPVFRLAAPVLCALAVTACLNTTPPSVPPNPPAMVPAAAPVTFTPEQRGRYDAERLHIEGTDDRYAFVDGLGTPLTENDFIRRFKNLTRSNELDAMNRRRTKRQAVISAVILTAAVALTVSSSIWCATEDCGDLGAFLIPVGAVGSLAGGAGLLNALTEPDGRIIDHFLSRAHAQLYAAKYNEELLVRERSETTGASLGSSTRGASVSPVVAPSFLGVVEYIF